MYVLSEWFCDFESGWVCVTWVLSLTSALNEYKLRCFCYYMESCFWIWTPCWKIKIFERNRWCWLTSSYVPLHLALRAGFTVGIKDFKTCRTYSTDSRCPLGVAEQHQPPKFQPQDQPKECEWPCRHPPHRHPEYWPPRLNKACNSPDPPMEDQPPRCHPSPLSRPWKQPYQPPGSTPQPPYPCTPRHLSKMLPPHHYRSSEALMTRVDASSLYKLRGGRFMPSRCQRRLPRNGLYHSFKVQPERRSFPDLLLKETPETRS